MNRRYIYHVYLSRRLDGRKRKRKGKMNKDSEDEEEREDGER